MKDVELKLISELMKNSRRSDRELAKAVGVSQPTVSRLIKKLEKDGVIKEYTMIPDFGQLGYQIMAVQFLGKSETQNEEKSKTLRTAAIELERKSPQACLTVTDGIGLGKGRMLINFYEDYTGYTEGLRTISSLPNVEADNVETFLIDLNNKRNFRVLSMTEIARHVKTIGKTSKEE